jgi:hypothetical protein
MIKHKKYTHTKGGRIVDFDFDFHNNNNNNKGVTKKFIYFYLKLSDDTIGKFKISQHTFAHFDEFSNQYLNKQITNFTHIMQYFTVFIFLLNSMNLTNNDFDNPTKCKGIKIKDNTCYIIKEGIYNLDTFNSTIYINKPVLKSNNTDIYITSLFERNDGKILISKDIQNIELNNKIKNNKDKTNIIKFTENTIETLLSNQDKIINNNYNIDEILDLMKNDFIEVSTSTPTPMPTPTPTSTPQPKTSNKQILPTVYTFSIPKNSGGKKNKTYKNHKYKKHKHKKEKGHKDKGQKTRKK